MAPLLRSICAAAAVVAAAGAASSGGIRYNARVVAGGPVIPDSCDIRSCGAQPVPPCMLELSLLEPIRQASKDGVDILVFPETYFVDAPAIFSCPPPPPETFLPQPGPASLCPKGAQPKTWWAQVACWAKQYHVLVVVGAYDWGPCMPAAEPFTHRNFPCFGNATVFNKALAFGVHGELLLAHHKHHLAHAMMPTRNISAKIGGGLVMNTAPVALFNDDPAAPWPVPDVATFTSHFGVEFGVIICHELNFASPILSLLKKGVRDIVFPTEWGGFIASFQGYQSGFAVAHGVNLLAANGFGGGSGLWPADAAAAPVQYPVAKEHGLMPTPQWLGTLRLESPRTSRPLPPVVAPPAPHRVVTRSKQIFLPSASVEEVELNGSRCRAAAKSDSSSGSFVMGLSRGINLAGLYETTCWLVNCDFLNRRRNSTTAPTLWAFLLMPFTTEDVKFCAEQDTGGSEMQAITLQVQAEGMNFLVPDVQCPDASVPLPRPFVAEAAEGWSTMKVSGSCAVDHASIRAFAQSEYEMPQCPDGFCPSPTLCTVPNWEVLDQTPCPLVPAAPEHAEQPAPPSTTLTTLFS